MVHVVTEQAQFAVNFGTWENWTIYLLHFLGVLQSECGRRMVKPAGLPHLVPPLLDAWLRLVWLLFRFGHLWERKIYPPTSLAQADRI